MPCTTSSSGSVRIYQSPYSAIRLSPLPLLTFLESQKYLAKGLKAYENPFTGAYYTREQVFDRARRFGAGLRSSLRLPSSNSKSSGGLASGGSSESRNELSLKPGDTVVVFGKNSIDYPVVILGCISAGLVPSLASSAFTPPEIAYQVSDSKAKLVLCDPELLPTLQKSFETLKAPVPYLLIQKPASIDKTQNGSLYYENFFKSPQPDFKPASVATTTTLICYSSGTTGNPKGVEMTHRNLTTSVQSCGAPIRPFKPGQDVTIGYLPWYHLYGGMFVMFLGLYEGFNSIAMPKFDIDAYCEVTQRYKVTFGFVVPPTLMRLAKDEEVDKYDMSSVKWLMTAAAPCKEELTRAVESRFPNMAVCQFYGATEATPTATMLDPSDARANRGTVGKLLPTVEGRIVDDDGNDVPEGEVGELWIRGPVIMKGYLGRPEATRDAITPEGFYKTGDMVFIKDDIIKVVDRKKELIKYKSLQVAPAELEGVLIAHPEIADVGVIGVWSEKQQTELPRAYIVPAKGCDAYRDTKEKEAFADRVNKWYEPQVAHYKWLRGGIELIDTMPRLLSGKIKRRDLREKAKLDWKDVDEVRSGKVKAKL